MFLNYSIFSHPDYTVGSGISPDHASRLAGCTAGREFHPALKIYSLVLYKYTTRLRFVKAQCSGWGEMIVTVPSSYAGSHHTDHLSVAIAAFQITMGVRHLLQREYLLRLGVHVIVAYKVQHLLFHHRRIDIKEADLFGCPREPCAPGPSGNLDKARLLFTILSIIFLSPIRNTKKSRGKLPQLPS